MKQVTIAGRITRDATLRNTQNNDAVLGFSVAVDDGWGQNKRTLFFECSLWGKRGQALSQHLSKGTPVTVAGDLSTREYEGKTYLTIRVNEVTLQGSGRESNYRHADPAMQAPPVDDSLPDFDSSEIPF